jgi:hypothetical protein
MARRLCPDQRRAAIALIAIAVLGILSTIYAQLIVIALGAMLGLGLSQTTSSPDTIRVAQHRHEIRVFARFDRPDSGRADQIVTSLIPIAVVDVTFFAKSTASPGRSASRWWSLSPRQYAKPRQRRRLPATHHSERR